ncbi:MAG: amino acid permease-associated protein [Bryobacterales bacterium]|nr:amino acid permease-associated protein [Bryobacterales bacterium]
MNASPNNVSLVRSMTRLDVVAVTLNAVIGAGIFGLPAKVFALVGDYSLLAFLACAAFAALIVLCFAEVGSRFSGTGGPYLYLREALGPVAGFGAGWLTWLARVSAFAANSNLLAGYVAVFAPAVASGAGRLIFLCTVTLLLIAVNYAGVQGAVRLNRFFTAGKLIPLSLWLVSNSTWREARDTAIAVAVGFAILAVTRASGSRKHTFLE